MVKLDQLVEQIKSSPEFQKLKTVIENNGYHDNEPVYSHLIKTYEIAEEKIKGDFISNQEAKKLWDGFLAKEVAGMARKDILVLVALLHDFGKVLSYEDNGKTESILSNKPNNTTQCSGHEYWGSVFIKDFLKQFSLPIEIIEYISNLIRLHDSINEGYFSPKKGWPIELIVKDLKSRSDVFYIEALFNIYCDCYNAKPFQFALKTIEELFNQPNLYLPRKYFID